MPPLPRLGSTQNRSVGAANRNRSGAEQSARTTAVAVPKSTQAPRVCSRIPSTLRVRRHEARSEPFGVPSRLVYSARESRP